MKNIKLNKNIKLDYNLENNILNLSLNGSKVELYINKCELCGKEFLSLNKFDLCEKCNDYIVTHNKNLIPQTKSEFVINPIKKTKNNRGRFKGHVINYKKGVIADSSIVINNLVECHNLINDYMSIGKLETLLRFSIARETFESIGKKLRVCVSSVRRDYGILAKRGIVAMDHNIATVQNIVKYNIVNGAKIAFINSLSPTDVRILKSAHKKLDDVFASWEWLSKEAIQKRTSLKIASVDKYLNLLNREGCLQIRHDKGFKQFKMVF